MDIRYATHPDHVRTLDSDALRREFLIDGLFAADAMTLTYTHVDRVIVGSIMPVKTQVTFPTNVTELTGSDFFLERRELGLINIGGTGTIEADGTTYRLGSRDALYIGRGMRELRFTSDSADHPAKFYFNSTPAHTCYPTRLITVGEAKKLVMGNAESCNRRTIFQYLIPGVVDTCQLVMGLTQLDAGSVWNTMPCHTHERRMEVYFYFHLSDDSTVFHLMGQADETRHIVVRNEQAVISPSWSIHSGVGTQAYAFIWGMAGENQIFADMDHVPMSYLK